MSSPTAPAGGTAESDATEPADDDGPRFAEALYWVRVGTYLLSSLLALSLLVVGTVAVIAEVKGTWHWAIHLESTISYMGILMGGLLVLLVPLLLVSLTARVVYDV
ncbi:hypothetical protein [Halobaculum sp. EA56]|uniref:hypothetical protein n=1 Tax=Halobaculum sp. EA56 TaxID=3421648 RepID=UPI003EBD8E81